MKRGAYYNIIKSNGLDYINCDEYIRDPSAIIVNYVVRLSNKDVKLVNAALIFRNTNSYLELSLNSHQIASIYARLPLNDKVELLVTGTKNDKPYLYHGEIKLSKEKEDLIELTATTYEIVKEKLK